jgi:hypothetical protein
VVASWGGWDSEDSLAGPCNPGKGVAALPWLLLPQQAYGHVWVFETGGWTALLP